MSKYIKIYDKFIDRVINENRSSEDDTVYQKHHILPRCMGGVDDQYNIVRLTPKEHFIAHLMLYRIYPDVIGLQAAIMILRGCCVKDGEISYAFNSRTYQEAAEKYSETVLCKKIDDYTSTERINKNDPRYNSSMIPFNKNVKFSKEHCENISKVRKEKGIAKGENNPMFGNGHKVTGDKNGRYGKPTSKETRAKQSNAKKKFIEKNGTASFGKGQIYIRDLETNKLKRVPIEEALALDKTDKFSISCNAKNKLIKEGVIDE
jgi:hypothetical protein